MRHQTYTVTFPAAGHHLRPLTGTKLYCLATKANVCEQLAQGVTRKRNGRNSNPRPFESHVQRSNDYATDLQNILRFNNKIILSLS